RQSRRLEDGKFRPLRMPGKPERTIFAEFCGLPYLICARQNVKTAALDLARERQAHEAGARTRATAHERTPQQERQKAAREAERGREAWTLGQGMKKPVAGCYGRLTRWKGGGDVVYMALL
ncbi:hypothetical protein ACTMK1_22215, partial [Escherichia coli]|uniref:hypothetical protein n=1 Tax=Escherichia coli TaxID=562 RepID=UPI003F8ABB9D